MSIVLIVIVLAVLAGVGLYVRSQGVKRTLDEAETGLQAVKAKVDEKKQG